MPGHLQEGIFHAKGERPKPFFGMLFVRAGAGFGATEVGDALVTLWEVWRDLKRGTSPDYSPVGEDDEWTYGGTYLAFIKLTVDLSSWRTLLRERQELLVGRDKLSGCPLVSKEPNAGVPGCPATGTHEVGEDAANNVFREPPSLPETEQALNSSHVQRANHHIDPFHDLTAQRIFRQGYEFLEAVDGSPQFRAGLNFVSFQNTPLKLFRVLVQQGWLGSVNFGGQENNQPGAFASLLSARAAGIFLVPPVVDGDRFPGESIFF